VESSHRDPLYSDDSYNETEINLQTPNKQRLLLSMTFIQTTMFINISIPREAKSNNIKFILVAYIYIA